MLDMMLLLNLELVSRVKSCLVSGFPHIVNDYHQMRNLPKIFLRSFENVGSVSHATTGTVSSLASLQSLEFCHDIKST